MKSVAIQGIQGSYSEQAARQLLGPDIDVVECQSFNTAIDRVVKRVTELAVLPVENKIVGRIEPAATLVENCGLHVIDECQLAIEHVLIAAPSANFENLDSVASHPEALRQCERFFGDHPRLGQIFGSDTASCVKDVVDSGNRTRAAIGSLRAVEIYGGKVLRNNIADEPRNWTRFMVIGRSS